MDDEDFEFDEKYLEFRRNQAIILCIGGVIMTILMIGQFMGVFVEPTPFNSTEMIFEKKIQYEGYPINDFRYYIFTNNYCFSVDLPTYNKLNVNDNVTILHNSDGNHLIVDEYYFREN